MNPFLVDTPVDRSPQAQMDNMDFPPNVMRIIPGIPANAKTWGQFIAWVAETNADIPDEQMESLFNVQLSQFRCQVMSQSQGEVPKQAGGPKRVEKYPASFQCVFCPKRFILELHLRFHLRTHTYKK